MRLLALWIAVFIAAYSAQAAPPTELYTGLATSLPTGSGADSRDGGGFSVGVQNIFIQAVGDSQTETNRYWCGYYMPYGTRCQNYGVGGADTLTMSANIVANIADPTVFNPDAEWAVWMFGSNDYIQDPGVWNVTTDFSTPIQTGIDTLETAGYKVALHTVPPRCPNAGTLRTDCDCATTPEGAGYEYLGVAGEGRVQAMSDALDAIFIANPSVTKIDTRALMLPYFDGPGGLDTCTLLRDHVHLRDPQEGGDVINGAPSGGTMVTALTVATLASPATKNQCVIPQAGLAFHWEPSYGMPLGTSVSNETANCGGSSRNYAIKVGAPDLTSDWSETFRYTCSGGTGVEFDRDELPNGHWTVSNYAGGGRINGTGTAYKTGNFPLGDGPMTAYYAVKQVGATSPSPGGFWWGNANVQDEMFGVITANDDYGWSATAASFGHLILSTAGPKANLAGDGTWRVIAVTSPGALVDPTSKMSMHISTAGDDVFEMDWCHGTDELVNCLTSTTPPLGVKEDNAPRWLAMSLSNAVAQTETESAGAAVYSVAHTDAERQAVFDYWYNCVLNDLAD